MCVAYDENGNYEIEVVDDKAAIQKRKPIEELTDEIFGEAAQIVQDSLRFREISPDQKDPPIEWVRQFGQEEADRMFRVAQASWLPAKCAPIGIKNAMYVAVGILKARAAKSTGNQTLNVAVMMPSAISEPPSFPEVEVEK